MEAQCFMYSVSLDKSIIEKVPPSNPSSQPTLSTHPHSHSPSTHPQLLPPSFNSPPTPQHPLKQYRFLWRTLSSETGFYPPSSHSPSSHSPFYPSPSNTFCFLQVLVEDPIIRDRRAQLMAKKDRLIVGLTSLRWGNRQARNTNTPSNKIPSNTL